MEAKIGDLVVVHGDCGHYYTDGAKAVLTEFDGSSWWGNFRVPENKPGTFHDVADAVWCIGEQGDGFSLVMAKPTPLPDEAMAGEQEID